MLYLPFLDAMVPKDSLKKVGFPFRNVPGGRERVTGKFPKFYPFFGGFLRMI